MNQTLYEYKNNLRTTHKKERIVSNSLPLPPVGSITSVLQRSSYIIQSKHIYALQVSTSMHTYLAPSVKKYTHSPIEIDYANLKL